MDGQTHGRMHGRTHTRTDARTHGWTESYRHMHRQTDRQTAGQSSLSAHTHTHTHTHRRQTRICTYRCRGAGAGGIHTSVAADTASRVQREEGVQQSIAQRGEGAGSVAWTERADQRWRGRLSSPGVTNRGGGGGGGRPRRERLEVGEGKDAQRHTRAQHMHTESVSQRRPGYGRQTDMHGRRMHAGDQCRPPALTPSCSPRDSSSSNSRGLGVLCCQRRRRRCLWHRMHRPVRPTELCGWPWLALLLDPSQPARPQPHTWHPGIPLAAG